MALLRRAGNRSRYIAAVVRQRASMAQGAYSYLKGQGLTDEDVRRGVTAAAGWRGINEFDGAADVIGFDGRDALAIVAIAREYWAGNAEIRTLVDGKN